jgi:dolichol-phosphate mannosyltransferase
MDQNLVSVILPTYNERNTIRPLIKAIHGALKDQVHEIIVIDDNSPDGTYQAVCDLNDERVKIILRTSEPSLAGSIRCGIEKACGEILVVMDSDFDHDPKYIPVMMNMISRYDCVCASRFLYGGRMNGWFRALASWTFNIFIRIATGSSISDHLYGYFAIKRKVLERCPLDKIFYGYGDYYIRLLYYLQRNKTIILQFPAINGGRVRAKGLNFLKIFWRYSLTVLRLPQLVAAHV